MQLLRAPSSSQHGSQLTRCVGESRKRQQEHTVESSSPRCSSNPPRSQHHLTRLRIAASNTGPGTTGGGIVLQRLREGQRDIPRFEVAIAIAGLRAGTHAGSGTGSGGAAGCGGAGGRTGCRDVGELVFIDHVVLDAEEVLADQVAAACGQHVGTQSHGKTKTKQNPTTTNGASIHVVVEGTLKRHCRGHTAPTKHTRHGVP